MEILEPPSMVYSESREPSILPSLQSACHLHVCVGSLDLSLAVDSPEGRVLCFLFMPNFQSFANFMFAIRNNLIKFHEGAPYESALPMALGEHL